MRQLRCWTQSRADIHTPRHIRVATEIFKISADSGGEFVPGVLENIEGCGEFFKPESSGLAGVAELVMRRHDHLTTTKVVKQRNNGRE